MKIKFIPFVLLVIASLLAGGCSKNSGDVAAVLDHGFPLAIGQKAVLYEDELEIRFEDILEDSRCPAGAQCVWEGRVSARVEFKDNKDSYKMVLVQSGSAQDYVNETYKDYLITYKITPYPRQNETIDKKDYRLLLVISHNH
ncbi:MAG: hypothetical protein PHT28_03130 [Dehalococcoidales bacterium]|jgi:hypothetical protein|nr:hypothetical protein [Dehalococcoidales bacterium]MDD4230050.1 hypothetical protein [Dehalococcoidales bacterium]MDD4465787.1 hypothetical protein [Dehalococcoidales bacterium]MDD5401699.1 hypothetical protein [Dehalococcoidales bacterium]